MHKTINNINLAGFADQEGQPGDNIINLIKEGFAISNSDQFYVYAEQIANIIFPKLGIPDAWNRTNRYVAVIHPDLTADIYLDDFQVKAKAIASRAIEKGQLVSSSDIKEIIEVNLPDIQLNPNDQFIFLLRIGLRFGIYFDLSREIEMDKMPLKLAEFHSSLLFQRTLDDIIADLQLRNYDIYIITEGKTDWKHLEKAFQKISYDKKIRFSKTEDELGDTGLLGICRSEIHLPFHDKPIICIFDRDNPKIIKQLTQKTEDGTEFQYWGNNVFSIMLPIPADRKDYENICIEMYYADEVIKRETKDGKRLYFDNELKKIIMPDNSIRRIPIPPENNVELTKKLASDNSDNIEDSLGQKKGISKTVFADLIYNEENPFNNINFENFELITEVIEKVLNHKPV